jgi:hypothetical protein
MKYAFYFEAEVVVEMKLQMIDLTISHVITNELMKTEEKD